LILNIIKGNNKVFEITLTDDDDNAMDLTGGTLNFTLTDWRGEVILTKTSDIVAEIEIVDAEAGQSQIKFVPADTTGVDIGTHIFYVNLTDVSSQIFTVLTGNFILMDLGTTAFIRNKVRNFTGDFSELNLLLQAEETSDEEFFDYIQKSVEMFNSVGYLTTYVVSDFPSLDVLVDGTVIQILVGKGILSARNMLTYQDNGGVTVQDLDVYGRYTNLFNVLIAKYMKQATDVKRSINVDKALGNVASPWEIYGNHWYWGYPG